MLALWQTAPSDVIPWWASLGVGGTLAGVMFFFYRTDRKSTESALLAALRESDDRWKALSSDFKAIIQDNTRAITSLESAMRNVQCPLAGQQPANIVSVPKPRLSAGT